MFEPTLTIRPPMRLSSTVLSVSRPCRSGLQRLGQRVGLAFGQRWPRSPRRSSRPLPRRSARADRRSLAAARTAGAWPPSGPAYSRQRRQTHLGRDRRDRTPCSSRLIDRRRDQVAKIRALGERGSSASTSCSIAVQMLAFLGEFEHGRRIAPGDPRGDRSWFGHVHPSDILAPVTPRGVRRRSRLREGYTRH